MQLPSRFTTGPFTTVDAVTSGCTLDELRQGVRSGRLVQLRRGVLATAEARHTATRLDTTWHAQDIEALGLAMPRRRLVAVGTSAARIHGLPMRSVHPAESTVAVSGRPGTAGTHRHGYYLRVARLPEAHVEERLGVRVTTAARTVLDLAAHDGFEDGVVAAEGAYRLGLLTPDQLRATVLELERRPGIEVARECLEFADPATESVLESISRLSMRTAGIPMPQLQVVLLDDGYRRIRVDFFWPLLRLVGEADGKAKYTMNGRDPRAAKRDEAERERIIRGLGFDLVRWDWHIGNDPDLLDALLRTAFAQAQRRLGRVG
jgi:hypothetical protein